jgi:hypothetical protein
MDVLQNEPLSAETQAVRPQKMDKEKLLDKIIELTTERAAMHPNHDGGINDYWNACAELLSVNLKKTKWVLDRVGSEKLYWIAEAFEDISKKLQSWEFIDYLEQPQNRYPDVDMKVDIQFATEWIEVQR